MSQAVQLAGAQQQQISLDIAAVLGASHIESAEDQSLANGVAAAAVQQTDDDAGSQVTFAGIVTDAAVMASKTEADAAGIALKTVNSDAVVAAHKIVAATVLQTHSYLTNGMTWVTTVVPLAVAAQVAENNAAAAEVGQVDEAGADEVEAKTAAAVAQVNTDVPAAKEEVGKAADATKTLVGKIAQAEADDSGAEAEAEAAAVAALPNITFVQTMYGPILSPSGFGNPKNRVGVWGTRVADLGPIDNPMILDIQEQKLYMQDTNLATQEAKGTAILGGNMEVAKMLARMQLALNYRKSMGDWFPAQANMIRSTDEDKYNNLIYNAANKVPQHCLSVKSVSLMGLDKVGVVIQDKVSFKGIFVTAGPAYGNLWQWRNNQFNVKVEDWRTIKAADVRAARYKIHVGEVDMSVDEYLDTLPE